VSLSFLLAQSVSGLTAAMFLFIVASGLSLIFGVLRVLNFAHGSFYMLGAYAAWQVAQWIGTFTGSFWLAVLGSAIAVALLGGAIERCCCAISTVATTYTSCCSPTRWC
jgi:branched-chain amino acid transport system permease protein